MKALLLVPLLLLAGCVSAPAPVPAKKVTVTTQVEGEQPKTNTYYVVQQPYVVYEPRVTWSIGIGYGRGYYRPGPWRHHRHW
ncbi:MAG: hypothetical protein EBR30_00450 [Cytophagia bacterium]|nr:hypothetical protein [Cytophagia bacterium]